MCKGPKARRGLTWSKNSKRTHVVTLRGRAAEDKVHSYCKNHREMCVNMLCRVQSSVPLWELTQSSVSRVLPSGPETAGQKRKKKKPRKTKKKILEHVLLLFSTLTKLTISLIFIIKQSVRFSICIDIRSIKTRPNYLFFMYPTGLL